jgi:hypothetical protein
MVSTNAARAFGLEADVQAATETQTTQSEAVT